MRDIYSYAIKMVRYVLCGDVPDLTENIDFDMLFDFAQYHSIENIIYAGLNELSVDIPDSTMAKFKAAYNGAIVFDTMQDVALNELGAALEEATIDYIPLKGSVIKNYYPMPDYRKSGDIDILVHPEDENKVELLMMSLNYQKDLNRDEYEVHSSYIKEPYIEIEIHRSLALTRNRSYEFCAEIWKNVYLYENQKHRYCMNNEFLYVYLLSHLCHHLYEGGVGIRHITDFYILLKNIEINDELLNKHLKKANLTSLNNMVREIIEKWYGNVQEMSKHAETLEKIIFTSGNYGTKEIQQMIRSSNGKWGKITILLRKIFPPSHWLKRRYPILNNKPYLMPVMWCYRFFDIFVNENDKVSDKFESLLGSKENKKSSLVKIADAIKNK